MGGFLGDSCPSSVLSFFSPPAFWAFCLNPVWILIIIYIYIYTAGERSQIEGITNIEGNKYFLSREYRSVSVNGVLLELPQHLFRFDNGSYNALSVLPQRFGLLDLYPNPISGSLHISGAEIVKLVITDSKGRRLITKKNPSIPIQLDALNAGIYYVQITTRDQTKFTKKIMKY